MKLPPQAGVDPLAPAASLVRIPGYEIISELGRGGMGVVYLAQQTALNRSVALKMILAGAHAGLADVERFTTEARSIARLQHPNIVQIYEVGEHAGLPYLSLEFCSGGSLEGRLSRTPLAPGAAAALVQTLARAMHAAHGRGVIHRDLKPANVLLTDDGTPKISDFGLARQLDQAGKTASGAVLGTPSYMAPEQAGGQSKLLGPACDVYALGAILYECLTGRPPFKAATPLDTLLQVLGEEPAPPRRDHPEVPRDLETICLQCLQKDPHHRYPTAAALADDLGRFLDGEAVSARPLGEWESAVRWAKKHPITAALTVLVVAAALMWMLVFVPLAGALDRSASMIFIASYDAGVAAFLATMALLVRPRRWVALTGALVVLVALAEPWLARAALGSLAPRARHDGQDFDAYQLLFIPCGLLIGALAAGLLGGLSRWTAQRYRSDMLTAFYGGGCAGIVTMFLCGFVAVIPMIITAAVQEDNHEPDRLLFVLYYCVTVCGALPGFWLGSTLTARATRPRLRPE